MTASKRAHRHRQEYEGRLSFATDAWTSPNHRAFIAITVHLEVNGEPLRLLLDLVEVAKVRTACRRRTAATDRLFVVAFRGQSCRGLRKGAEGVWYRKQGQ